jgi:ribosomal protein S18 acetylase RimI-like enzyme
LVTSVYGSTVVTIRRAESSDVQRVARTASLAFAEDPVMRWLFPDDDEYEALHQSVFGGIARRWMATDSLWCTDDCVAAAGWVPPGRPEVEMPDDAPQIEHPEWRLERFKALGALMDANTPAEPHWYLNLLATHPDWQRQGLGAELMGVVFEIADEAGLPCYLETERVELVAYYRHHGFDVRSEWDVRSSESDGPHMWGMLRPVP